MSGAGLYPPGSFAPDDVTVLLRDVSGLVAERAVAEREYAIQRGRHYSEDLPVERLPDAEYTAVFLRLLAGASSRVALYTGVLTRRVLRRFARPALVSLARSGTPCGVLMRRYARREMGEDLPHFTVSIIRGKGLDENALDYILAACPDRTPVFVDGWTGKGAIARELAAACAAYSRRRGLRLAPVLAALADPAGAAAICATGEDFLNPSCCLNSTVCGLLSRTVHNAAFIGAGDFHGVRVYREFAAADQTDFYLRSVEAHFAALRAETKALAAALPPSGPATAGGGGGDGDGGGAGWEAAERIGRLFGVKDINKVKPGLGETTRVLLRRVPERILLRTPDHPDLAYIRLLAQNKGVPAEVFPDMPYLCCGLIAEQGEGEA
ncbi:MAG: cysteine protease StiP family protein [Gracilibacteraceae bacterium]|nr:cysteine protease StiP family protein [Gracilibacteraceae bacterium]